MGLQQYRKVRKGPQGSTMLPANFADPGELCDTAVKPE